MTDVKVMGKTIRGERKWQLLAIEKFAEMAGITDNFLGKIERNEGVPVYRRLTALLAPSM